MRSSLGTSSVYAERGQFMHLSIHLLHSAHGWMDGWVDGLAGLIWEEGKKEITKPEQESRQYSTVYR
jgi:hypothetical protein